MPPAFSAIPVHFLRRVREVAGEQLHSLTGPRASSTYAAVEKTSHHRTVADLEKKPEPEAPPPDASLAEKMRHRLQTAEGKTLHKLRQQTVEPVFGIIKSPGVSAVSAPGPEQGIHGMDTRMPGLQRTPAAHPRSDEKRRGDGLKRPILRARATPGAGKSSRKGGVGRAQRGI
jgi:hypothetical protein